MAKSFGITDHQWQGDRIRKAKGDGPAPRLQAGDRGKRIWGDNCLLTKTYSCLESAARAFRALYHRLASALRAALLRLAASIPPLDAAGAAAVGRGDARQEQADTEVRDTKAVRGLITEANCEPTTARPRPGLPRGDG